MEVLGDFDEHHWSPQLASFLAHCQDPTGGFAGGPSQLPHLAPTYAAVSALMVAATPEAYRVVDRAAMYGFLMRMKSSEGGFKMHAAGCGKTWHMFLGSWLDHLDMAESILLPGFLKACFSYHALKRDQQEGSIGWVISCHQPQISFGPILGRTTINKHHLTSGVMASPRLT